MELTTTINVDISAKVLYRDGEVKVTLFASSNYAGGRQAQVSVDVIDGLIDDFEPILLQLIEDNQDLLLKKLEAGRSEAITAAARMGEI